MKTKKTEKISRKNVLFESEEVEGLAIKGYDFSNGVNYDKIIDSYLATGFQATHLGKAIEIIDKMIKDIIANDDKLANMVSICIADSLEWQALRLLTKALFRQKKHVVQILKRLDANKEKISRWEFYNAVTNYATHGERIKPHIETLLQNKAADIMKTPFAQLTESLVVGKQQEGQE